MTEENDKEAGDAFAKLILALGLIYCMNRCNCGKTVQKEIKPATNASSSIVLETKKCDEEFSYSGGRGKHIQRINLGDGIGRVHFNYNPYAVPDRFKVKWGDKVVIDTGFVGDGFFDEELKKMGYGKLRTRHYEGFLNNFKATIIGESTSFLKYKAKPNYIEIITYAPLDNTHFNYRVSCPK